MSRNYDSVLVQIQCIELPNTVAENVVKSRTFRERGRMRPSRDEGKSARPSKFAKKRRARSKNKGGGGA
jgi:hypothetical protein